MIFPTDTSLTDILDGMASKLNGTILRVNVDENNILMEPSQSKKIPVLTLHVLLELYLQTNQLLIQGPQKGIFYPVIS